MNEKKRSFVRLSSNSSRSSSFQISPPNVQQKRIGVIPTFGNALPSLAPISDNHSFQQLKSLYADVSTSISQFINHSSANFPFRASLALLIKDSDSLFQTFYSTSSKVFGIMPISQHGHSNLSKTINSSSVPNGIFGSQRSFLNMTTNTSTNNADSNVTELNLRNIKTVTEPFLMSYMKLSNQIFVVKDSGFASIIEGITNLFNTVFSVIEQLGNIPSNTANVRENPKKISMTLKSNANQIHSSIRKFIQMLSNFMSIPENSSSCNDTEQKVKQIVGMVHDFSQMFSNTLANDFTASIATQECNIIRNEVLAALNDIIQDVRSVALFESDISCITSSMSQFEQKLKSFVYSIGLSFPNEEEIKNNKFSNENDGDSNSNSNESNNNSEIQSNTECSRNISILETKSSNELNDESNSLNFDETMNVYELIQVAEKLFPKSLAVYSQDLSSSMMRFLSLLRGKLVEYETNFKKINANNNEIEIKRIKKMNDFKVKQLEDTIKSLNQSLLKKNKDIDLFQNPSMQYLQDVVSLLYSEDGQTSNKSMKITEFDLIDPLFMKRLTDRINELKSRKNDDQSKSSDNSDKCEDAKKKLIQILENQKITDNNEDDILTLVEKCQKKIEKNNEEIKNVRKFSESLKEGLNQLTSIFPSLSDEFNSMINCADDSNLDKNALKIIELLKKSIEDEKKLDKANDNEMFEKFKTSLSSVVEKISKFLNITPPDKPILESVEYLLIQLEQSQKK